MSIILNIDTSLETAFVCIAENGKPIFHAENHQQNNHAGFIHSAIDGLCIKSRISLNELDAIAVTKGPGSYTGLRIGMSTAKGLCFTLQKPLITIGTLEMMGNDIINNIIDTKSLFCSLIDARRMEVFTAVYDHTLNEILPPIAMILDHNSFDSLLDKHKIYFVGSGANKFQNIINNSNAFFTTQLNLPLSLSTLANNKFNASAFNELALCEPFYLKGYKVF